MQQKLLDLSTRYLAAGNAIHDAIRDIVQGAGGFINASNNQQEKPGSSSAISARSIPTGTSAEKPPRTAGNP